MHNFASLDSLSNIFLKKHQAGPGEDLNMREKTHTQNTHTQTQNKTKNTHTQKQVTSRKLKLKN